MAGAKGALGAGALQQEAQLQHQQLLESEAAPGCLRLLLTPWNMPAPHSLRRAGIAVSISAVMHSCSVRTRLEARHRRL